jgi:hypothetical protein
MKKLFENWRKYLSEGTNKWYHSLTSPKIAEGPSPGFRIKLPNGRLSNNPKDYPRLQDVLKDPDFCLTAKAIDKGIRSSKPLAHGYYLHLYFDKNGLMILKDMQAPGGKAHTGGSHYDKFGVMTNVGPLKCQYNPFGIAAHAAGEVIPGAIKDFYKKHIGY